MFYIQVSRPPSHSGVIFFHPRLKPPQSRGWETFNKDGRLVGLVLPPAQNKHLCVFLGLKHLQHTHTHSRWKTPPPRARRVYARLAIVFSWGGSRGRSTHDFYAPHGFSFFPPNSIMRHDTLLLN